MTPSETPDEELQSVLDVAVAASAKILEVIAGTDLGAREKEDAQGPVTEADLAADQLLRDELGRLFPDDAVVTEETWEVGQAIEAAHRLWLVDPLDGTRELLNGNQDFSVMIGLLLDGAPELGVVHQPQTDLAWLGRVSTGQVWLGRPGSLKLHSPHAIAASDRAAGKHKWRLAVSRSHSGRTTKQIAKAFRADVVPRGSVGLKVGMLVGDEADAYVSGSQRMKVWDTAGPSAILLAAGGVVEAIDGTALQWTGDAVHRNGLRAFASGVADHLRPTVDDAVANMKTNTKKG